MNKPYKNRIDETGMLVGVVATILGVLLLIGMAPSESTTPAPMAPVTAPAESVPTALVDEVVIENLRVAGHEVNYDGSTGEWTVDDEVVGWSEAEDEDFEATGMIEEIEDAQP